jgi:acetyl/propionyl-CoA carboxylase alpha subunit
VYVCRRAAGEDLFQEELILKPHLPPEIQSTIAFSVLIFGERTVWEPHSHLMKDDDFLADEASDEASDEEEEEEEQEQEGTENDQSLLREAKMLARSSSSRRAVRTNTTRAAQVRLISRTNCQSTSHVPMLSNNFGVNLQQSASAAESAASASESAATSVGSSTEDELAEDLEPSVSVNL